MLNGPEFNPALLDKEHDKKCTVVCCDSSNAVEKSSGRFTLLDVPSALISGCHEHCNKGTDAPTEVTNWACILGRS